MDTKNHQQNQAGQPLAAFALLGSLVMAGVLLWVTSAAERAVAQDDVAGRQPSEPVYWSSPAFKSSGQASKLYPQTVAPPPPPTKPTSPPPNKTNNNSSSNNTPQPATPNSNAANTNSNNYQPIQPRQAGTARDTIQQQAPIQSRAPIQARQ